MSSYQSACPNPDVSSSAPAVNAVPAPVSALSADEVLEELSGIDVLDGARNWDMRVYELLAAARSGGFYAEAYRALLGEVRLSYKVVCGRAWDDFISVEMAPFGEYAFLHDKAYLEEVFCECHFMNGLYAEAPDAWLFDGAREIMSERAKEWSLVLDFDDEEFIEKICASHDADSNFRPISRKED